MLGKKRKKKAPQDIVPEALPPVKPQNTPARRQTGLTPKEDPLIEKFKTIDPEVIIMLINKWM